jgi:hypothetical protein
MTNSNNKNIPPYLKKNTSSTLLSLSTAIALPLLASPLVSLSNILLQPVQASPNLDLLCMGSFNGMQLTNTTLVMQGFWQQDSQFPCGAGAPFTVTTTCEFSYNDKISMDMGSSNLFSTQGQVDCSIDSPTWIDSIMVDNVGPFNMSYVDGPVYLTISARSTDNSGGFSGFLDLKQPSHSSSTSSTPMTGTTTTQDSDGDGIPDSSDRCASNSNQRCYKESK